MIIKVFGQLTDVCKRETICVENASDLEELKRRLLNLFPALAEKTFVVAVNKKIIHKNISLPENAEIALLPPFSGG